MLLQPDTDIELAARHINNALQTLKQQDYERFSDAAHDLRLTAYGQHCTRKALLARILHDLQALTVPDS